MSDDTIDEIFIGPMPASEEDTTTLTQIENSEETITVGRHNPDEEDEDKNNYDDLTPTLMINLKDDPFNKLNNRSDSDQTMDVGDNAPDNRPPSPQPLFLRSEIGPSLDGLEYHNLIHQIAETNTVDKPWSEIKGIIRSAILEQCAAIETVLSDSDVLSMINGIKTNIIHCIDHHEGTPFSIQRLCELIRSPTRHYRLFIKYLHAIDKVLSVASTWESFYEKTSAQSTDSHQSITDFITRYETPHITLSPIQGSQFDTDEDDNDDDEPEIDDDEDDDEQQTSNDTDIDTSNNDTETDATENDMNNIDLSNNDQQDLQDRNEETHGGEEGDNDDLIKTDTTHTNGSSDDNQHDVNQDTNGMAEGNDDGNDDDAPVETDTSLHTNGRSTTSSQDRTQATEDTTTVAKSDSSHTTETHINGVSKNDDKQDRNGLADDKAINKGDDEQTAPTNGSHNDDKDDVTKTDSARILKRNLGSSGKQKQQHQQKQQRQKRQKQAQTTQPTDSKQP